MADERVPCAEARDLCQYFDVKTGTFSNVKKTVKAVDHVSLAIARGETLGIVGESGCGKTTLGKTMLYLEKPTSGKVFLNGQDLSELSREELRRTRAGPSQPGARRTGLSGRPAARSGQTRLSEPGQRCRPHALRLLPATALRLVSGRARA